MKRVIGINPRGETVCEHDGVSEWADCPKCGEHIDGTADWSQRYPNAQAVGALDHDGDWNGKCPVCGSVTGLITH